MADSRICSINGCNKPVKSRGWCSAHYERNRKYGEALAPIRTPRRLNTCIVAGCNKPVKATGLCHAHYSRQANHGTPTGGRIPQGEAFRFYSDVVLRYADGEKCLIWPYGRDSAGYGRIWTGKRADNVCRLVCEAIYGTPARERNISAHSCGNGHIGCVNPHHLRWATTAENAADMIKHKAAGIGRFVRANVS